MMKNQVKKLFAIAFVMGASTASADVPRTLASGAPACGNTGGKGPSMCQQAESAVHRARGALATAIHDERQAVAALLTRPRVLASGAPACGNTGGKTMECTTQRADTEYEFRVKNLVRAGERIRKARIEVASAEAKFAKYAAVGGDALAMGGE